MTALIDKPAKEKEMVVTAPGYFGKIKWAIMRKMLSTVGRTSEGVKVGYQYGFDSGNMLDYVYVNRARGAFLVGKMFDRYFLNAVGWRGIRARRELLKNMLKARIAENRALGLETRLLDVAAGPGRYLQELLVEINENKGDVQVLCRDLSTEGLDQGKRQAEQAGLKHIRYEQSDAFRPAPTDLLGGAPNIIVVSGLYELLLDDELIQRSLGQLYSLLEPGGMIFFTTQTRHPQLEMIANVLPNRDGQPWLMKCRPAAVVESWARQAGFKGVQSQLEKVGLFSVTSGHKK